jgi:hypothetical protein
MAAQREMAGTGHLARDREGIGPFGMRRNRFTTSTPHGALSEHG